MALTEQQKEIVLRVALEHGQPHEAVEMIIERFLAALPASEQKPVAVVGDVYQLDWIGSGPIAPIIAEHGIKVGDKLFTHAPDSAARIAELESEVMLANELFAKQLLRADALNEKLRVARAIIKRISEQTPEKPDYWSSCSQCEHNASDCEDALATIGEEL